MRASLYKLNFIWHTQKIKNYFAISQAKVGFICFKQLKETLRDRRRRNVAVFMLFSCTGDSNSVSSSASLLVILDLPIKLSTLFMAVIMGLSSASCLFLDASIEHYRSTSDSNCVDSSEFTAQYNEFKVWRKYGAKKAATLHVQGPFRLPSPPFPFQHKKLSSVQCPITFP